MKIRSRLFSSRALPSRRFALHPLSFAVCLAMSSAALALPQGGTVVNGNATITKPTSTTELIKQTTDKAIIDWKSFSIAAGEKVRFAQPSDTSITLNRVTGYDPSYILGQMSSNGKIFLVNPYGVVFGAGARVDVGGLVVSSLSIADNDFLAGRYNLTSVDPNAPTQRGEVRNDGMISAPGGTVVLAGPSVTNTGTIVANGGRVGLVAANSVSVDVEGDGLIFFQANATEAQNRLAQLGRIQADGGTVEMRAAARGAFADTVLNMTGVVQARSIGTRGGQVVIDGGSDGITSVSGQIDASGAAAGQHGGDVTVLGQRILLDNGARIDASGDAGGGAIRIGGDFHGGNSDIRNADQTVVMADVQLHADAITQGDGGSIVVWSNDSTRYDGSASARGGLLGGDGGSAEVSGKNFLAYQGTVDTRAPLGKVGSLLLDPTDITISAAASSAGMSATSPFQDTTTASGTSNLSVAVLNAQLALTNVVVDATPAAAHAAPSGGTITVATDLVNFINWNTTSNLTLKAATGITVNAGTKITGTGLGNLNFFGDGAVVVNSPISLAGGNFVVAGTNGGATRAASFTSSAAGTITTTGPNGAGADGTGGGNVTIATSGDIAAAGDIAARGGDGPAGFVAASGGVVQLTTSDGAISSAAIDTTGGAGSSHAGGAVGGAAGNVTLTAAGGSAHAVVTGTITAVGGKGSNDSSAAGTGGVGGAGGAVVITNATTGNTTVNAIDTTGGAGGAAQVGAIDGGAGGAAGPITVSANGGLLTVASTLTAAGGGGGAGHGAGNPGAVGASQPITLDFGQTSVGSLDLTTATLTGASASANGGGTGTLIDAAAGGSTFNITGAGSGDVGSVTYTGVASLTGGAGADTFKFGSTAGAGLSGNIVGGGGTDTLDVSAQAGALVVNLQTGKYTQGGIDRIGGTFAGIGVVTGNDPAASANTTLVGPNGVQTFNVNAANAGNVAGVTFTQVGNLTGGTGNDAFVFGTTGTLTGAIDGGAGANSLDLSAKGGPVVLNQQSSTATDNGSAVFSGFSNIGSFAGNGTNTEIVGANAGQTFTLSAVDLAGSAGSLAFTGVTKLTGGTGTDTLVVANDLATITLTDTSIARTGLTAITLASIESASLTGGAGANAITASGFSGNVTVNATAGADSLTGNGLKTTLVGTNLASTFTVSANNAGTLVQGVDTTTFSGVGNLTGGTANDVFAFSNSATASLAGNIVGGGGTDTLDVSQQPGALIVNLQTGKFTQGGTDLIGGTFGGIGAVKGSDPAAPANTTLVGPNGTQTFNVSGANTGNVAGVAFTQVGNLTGGTGNDSFVLAAGGSLSGAVEGGVGNNTLDLSATAAANFGLTSASSGTASGITGGYAGVTTLVGNGNSTLTGTNAASTFTVNANDAGIVNDGVGTTNFSQVKNLTGGSANDIFAITGTAVLSGNIVGGGAVNTLDLSGYTNPVTVSATAHTVTGLTGTFNGISDFKGSGASTTLRASAAGSIFNITGAGSGDVAGLNFTSVGSVSGGAGADTFKFGSTAGAGLSGNIVGGGGTDTLDVSAQAGALVVNLQTGKYTQGGIDRIGGTFAGIGVVTGNDPAASANTTLVGPNGVQTFNVNAANAGNVAGVTFTQVGNLTGGTGNDAFVFGTTGTLTGAIDGGAGANSLDLSAKGGPVVLNQQSSTATDNGSAVFSGFSNIGSFAGNGTNTEIVGANAGQTFTLSAVDLAGSAGSLAFTGVTKLTGGTGTDTLVVANDLATITLTDTSIARTGLTAITLASIESASLTGGAGANAITASGFSGNVTVNATAGADSLTGNGLKTTLVGTNLASTFTVSANDIGNLVQVLVPANSTAFSGVGNLTGGTATDTFAITGTAALSGSIVGGGATNVLDLSGHTGAVTFNLPAGTATGVGGTFSGISSVIGNGAGTTVTGSASGSTFNVTAVDAGDVGGVAFTGAGSLLGGAGPDNFAITAAGSLTGNINGGGGVNTLDLSARGAANFGLTSASSGTASGVTGGYSNISTLIGNGSTSALTGTNAASTYTVTAPGNAGTVSDGVAITNFSGVPNLVGGTAADSFVVQAAGTLSGTINGGGGTDTLNLSAKPGLVTINQSGATTGSGITGTVSGIGTFVGNGTNTTFVGSNATQTYTVSAPDTTSVAGLTLTGVGNLTGGTSADSFVVQAAGTLSGTIVGGGGNDTLNLSAKPGLVTINQSGATTGSGITGTVSGIGTFVGNGANTTFVGSNATQTYTVSAPDTTSVAGLTLTGVGNLTGGTSADNFVVQAAGTLSGAVVGGGGNDTLNLSALGTASFGLTSASSGTASGVSGGYSNISTLIGNGTTSTLTGTNTASTYSVTAPGNAGTVNDGVATTTFSGVPNLVGGTAADSFVIGAGVAIGSIDGGSGANNSVGATATASENLTLADNLLTRASGNVVLANIASASLVGGSGNNVINASGWSGTVTVQATAGTDSITGNGVKTTVIGTAAPSTFNLTGPDSGTLNDGVNVTTLVSGVGNLTGGAGNDTFLIQNAGTLSGSLNGGGGLNTLDLSNKSSATIIFNTGSNSVSGVGIAGTLSNIGALIGNVTNTSLQGNASGQTFAITADNEITVDGNQVFKGVANLDAGVGPDSISGTTFKLAGHIDDAGGVTTLSGTIRTDGSQTYAGAVVAPAVTLVALGGISAVNPANDFGTVSLTGGAIDVHDANAINLTSISVGAGQPLAVTAGGTITLNGNVTSTADQTYNGNVALAGNAVLDAGAGQLAIRGTLDGGAHDLTLASSAAGPSAIALGGSVGNVGTFNANGNVTLTGNVASTGSQTFAGTLALTADTTLDAGASKLDLRGAVDGGGNSLVVKSTSAAPDAIHVGGDIADMTQFDANGHSTVGANVTTTGNQTYAGTVTLAADLTLDAGAGTIALQNGLDGSVATHSVTLASTAAGSNAITIGAPVANVGVVAVNGNATLAGNVSSTGTQTFAGTLTLTGDTTLDAGAGKVDLRGTVDGGGNSLTASSINAAADAIRIGGAIGNAAQFNANGRSTLDANVTTTGGQTYASAVTLGADTTLTGNAVSFGSTTDGAFNLDVKAGVTTFVGAVGSAAALASLTTDAAGSTQVGSSVHTTGAQTYNDNVVLTGDSTMTGSALAFNGQIDGAHALALTSASPVTFAQAIGATTPLAALSVAGPVALDGPSVATTGAQTYGGAVVLGAPTTLTGSTLGFASTIDGAVALTLNGASSFAGAVGAGTTLDSLTTNGAVQIVGNGVLRSSTINLNGPVSGATDLSLQTNALSGGNSIAGSGTFSIVPIDPSLSIGVAGGAGSLQVAQSVLTGATGFTSQVIGNANGSGTIAVGNLTLAADTTLQTATGDINLTGSVDGAHALTLNSGGTTRIAGPVGVTTPLTSLTTDNNAAATDWNGSSGERTTFDTADGTGSVRIVTTGAQTYNDPLTASVPVSFTGGAITATQATNSFAGTVSAVADSLQLKATGDLTLGGTITLANGGDIEAGKVLHLNGALQLNGGTLILTSDAALSAATTFADPTLPVNPRFGGVTLNEASAAIVQDGGTIKSAAGSLLVLRAPNGGSILLDQLDSSNLPVNQLLGSISAVSGTLGDDGSRFNGTTSPIDLGFIRIASSEIHVAGKPSGTDQTTLQAGLEGDVIKLTADVLTTGSDGLIRARLPFNSLQGSTSSIPALTFVLTPTALTNATPPNANSYGNPSPDSFIQIQIGSAAAGGFITARVIGATGSGAGKVIFLGGAAEARPFYDGNGKLTEIRIFYNGDAPRTPQEAGALAAVIAIIEEARHARFEEAVRTENVSSRLRSGVIAEVGAGRPATVGRESIKLPETCDVKPGTLRCE